MRRYVILMTQHVRTASVAVFAFFLGIVAARIPPAAWAAAPPLEPSAIDLSAITPDSLPTPTTVLPNIRAKVLVATDGMTISLATGTAPKHYHADANEIHIVLEGTGTEWLGDRQVTLRPGMMVVIPKGTNHAGMTETSGHLKFVAIKAPPQDAADIHFVP